MTRPLAIDLVADVVCPWCYLGWRRLKTALAARPNVDGRITWRAYQLDPSLPEEGVDRKAYMAAKFKDPARLKAAHDALV
ncbi:MAG: oxidoreductase, partial [Caulobacter sp.]|nr:oxidoreductase [Caulobacter sp.]